MSGLLAMFSPHHRLPLAMLEEALDAENCGDLVVAAQVILPDTLAFLMGDLCSINHIPLSLLKTVEGGIVPDLERVSVSDYGQTVCLGGYEVCADFLSSVVHPKKITLSSTALDMEKALDSLRAEGHDVDAMLSTIAPVVHGWLESHRTARSRREPFRIRPSMLLLTDGWMNGEGEPVAERAFNLAQEVLKSACSKGLQPPYVYPTLEGGVQAEWSSEGIEVSVEFYAGSCIASGVGVNVITGKDSEESWDVSKPEGVTSMSSFVNKCLNGTQCE